MSQLVRRDHLVPGDPGISLFVREVRPASHSAATPLVLLHGARVPGVPSFDLPVPGGSLAGDLANAGHPVFVMDARGYGGSTRPAEMADPPDAHAPLVRSDEVVHDIAAVIEWVVARTGHAQVALLGWATGGHWVGHYASVFSHRVSHLVLHNTLYGGTAQHPSLGFGSDLEDPARPGQFNAASMGAYRVNRGASLLPGWDASIPLNDKADWRDPDVATAYVAAALASDTENERLGGFRAPSGALEDSFYLATGRQLWDASLIRARTLIIHSERDFWSRPEDVEMLARHLVHAPHVRTVTIPDATHFAHLDRPERGRAVFMAEVLGFLAA